MQPTLLPLTRQSDRAKTSGGILLSLLLDTSIPFKFGKAVYEWLQTVLGCIHRFSPSDLYTLKQETSSLCDPFTKNYIVALY